MVCHILDAEELMEGLTPLVRLARKLQTEQGRLRNTGDTIGPTGDGVEVVQQDADHLAKAEGDDRQIVPAQP